MEEKKEAIRATDDEAIRQAKTLLRSARYGALAVIDPASKGPLASRVALATDIDGTPIILISGLAAHTAALEADPRCSVLVGEPGKGDPLAHPRMTLICRASKLKAGTPEHQKARRRYLNKQPKAKLYIDFGDFNLFQLDIQSASLNGGFGRAYALKREDLITASTANEGMKEREQPAIDHMNDDHLDAIAHYARYFAKAADGQWVLTGIDADGIDIANGDEVERVFFPEPLTDAAQMHHVLVAMAREGRTAQNSAR